MKRKYLYIVWVILLSIKSLAQNNDQCYGPNIGSGSLNAKIMIGCVPFTVEISKNDSVATGHKFIYDYKGGPPISPTEVPTFTYSAPGAYKLMQITYRKEDGKELRVCGVVTVLDTNKLILRPKICDKKVSLEIIDNKKPGTLPYDYCLINWGDGNPVEKIKLPTTVISHTYTNTNDRKVSVEAHYEVEFCTKQSVVDIIFPKSTQPQINLLEKTGPESYSLTFNNVSGEDVKVLGNNSLITAKSGELGTQTITFKNSAKNVCYSIKLENNCFPNNISKEICDIDFEVTPTENSNDLRWQEAKPAVIKDFMVLKNESIQLPYGELRYSDTTIKCNQENCYQIKFTSNETAFISNKICLKNTLKPCLSSIFIFIPLAFSPNNDGINDTFSIFGDDEKLISFSIYDQKGKLITTFTSIKDTWNGENYLSGTYPYRLITKSQGNEKNEIIGKITLLR